MCLVKNENDIIAQCLQSASIWSSAIIVYDNGSDDGTWGIVQDLARENTKIIPFKQDAKPFRDSLRGEIFQQYRSLSTDGDWWCRLDADEFYIDDPATFVETVPHSHDVVWSASFQFYFTEQEAAHYRSNPSDFARGIPVEQKCHYYRNDWSEPRLFRYHSALVYEDSDWPLFLGSSWRERIRLKHYQYRSPEQISKRLASRCEAMSAGLFRHEKAPDWSRRVSMGRPTVTGAARDFIPSAWEERIVDSSTLTRDDGDFVIDERRLPRICDLR